MTISSSLLMVSLSIFKIVVMMFFYFFSFKITHFLLTLLEDFLQSSSSSSFMLRGVTESSFCLRVFFLLLLLVGSPSSIDTIDLLLSKDLSLTTSNLFSATTSSILFFSICPAELFPPIMKDTCFSSPSAVFLGLPVSLNSTLNPDSFTSKVLYSLIVLFFCNSGVSLSSSSSSCGRSFLQKFSLAVSNILYLSLSMLVRQLPVEKLPVLSYFLSFLSRTQSLRKLVLWG